MFVIPVLGSKTGIGVMLFAEAVFPFLFSSSPLYTCRTEITRAFGRLPTFRIHSNHMGMHMESYSNDNNNGN